METSTCMTITLSGEEKEVVVKGYYSRLRNISNDIVYVSQFKGGTDDPSKRIALYQLDRETVPVPTKDHKLYLKGKGDVTCISSETDTDMIPGRNLLINPDLSIDQRGIVSCAGGAARTFIADDWYISRCVAENTGNAVNIAWDGVNGVEGYLQQQIEDSAYLIGKPITISLEIDGKRHKRQLTVPAVKNETARAQVTDDISIGISNYMGTHISVVIFVNSVQHTITRLKAEEGTEATQFCSPDPAEELIRCQRYYQLHSIGSINELELFPRMLKTPTITQLSDGKYSYEADMS